MLLKSTLHEPADEEQWQVFVYVAADRTSGMARAEYDSKRLYTSRKIKELKTT